MSRNSLFIENERLGRQASFDVALKRDGLPVACYISITSTVEH
jgi:hypothetical protein